MLKKIIVFFLIATKLKVNESTIYSKCQTVWFMCLLRSLGIENGTHYLFSLLIFVIILKSNICILLKLYPYLSE